MLTGQNGSGRAVAMWEPAPMPASPQRWIISGKRSKRHRVIFMRWLQQQRAMLSDTHLDCGNESVLSFNSSSETSVSRISGLDLLPYLRHRKSKKKVCR